MDQQPSYCLDISVGRNERYRDELIAFLKQTGAPFALGKASRGMWQGVKILRVETPKAEELTQHIIDGLPTGDDNDYEVHYSHTDANRSMTWLPDLDTAFGYKAFDLVPEAAFTKVGEAAGQGAAADFPKFGVTIDGVVKFIPMREIAAAVRSATSSADVMPHVIDAGTSIARDITPDEREQVLTIMEQCEA